MFSACTLAPTLTRNLDDFTFNINHMNAIYKSVDCRTWFRCVYACAWTFAQASQARWFGTNTYHHHVCRAYIESGRGITRQRPHNWSTTAQPGIETHFEMGTANFYSFGWCAKVVLTFLCHVLYTQTQRERRSCSYFNRVEDLNCRRLMCNSDCDVHCVCSSK